MSTNLELIPHRRRVDLFSLAPFSLMPQGMAPNAGHSGKQTTPIPFPSYRMVCFCSPGLSEVEIHVSCLWFGPFVSIVTTRTLLQKSPQGMCRGHFRQASVSLGKFSIKGGHLPYLCPVPPWHSPQGKDGKEDRRAGGREASLVLRRCPWWL